MARKPKKHPGGRPSQGLSEKRVEVPMSAAMKAVAQALADNAGVTLAEWIRQAIAEKRDAGDE